MVRRFLPRLPLFRALGHRITTPILPITRLSLRSTPPILTGAPHLPLLSHVPARFSSSSPPSPPLHEPSSTPPPDASLSQRLKHLIKSYGWYALGVYTILTVLDFGVAFAGVNLLGAEQVSRVAASVKATAASYVWTKPLEPGREEIDSASEHNASSQEGLYAMLLLAYTIHKTIFLPVRVGLTAALTPKLVHWLRARGWAGGAGTRRAAQEMRERMNRGRTRD